MLKKAVLDAYSNVDDYTFDEMNLGISCNDLDDILHGTNFVVQLLLRHKQQLSFKDISVLGKRIRRCVGFFYENFDTSRQVIRHVANEDQYSGGIYDEMACGVERHANAAHHLKPRAFHKEWHGVGPKRLAKLDSIIEKYFKRKCQLSHARAATAQAS
jgi:hypothetical protein